MESKKTGAAIVMLVAMAIPKIQLSSNIRISRAAFGVHDYEPFKRSNRR